MSPVRGVRPPTYTLLISGCLSTVRRSIVRHGLEKRAPSSRHQFTNHVSLARHPATGQSIRDVRTVETVDWGHDIIVRVDVGVMANGTGTRAKARGTYQCQFNWQGERR